MMYKKEINKEYFISVIAVLDDDGDILENFVNNTSTILKENYENYELIIIDNDSSDNTSNLIKNILEKEQCIRYLKLSKKNKLEVALSAGLETSIGDVIITLEPQSDPPAMIPEFVQKTILTGGVVYGRRNGYAKKMQWYYQIGNPLFHYFCNIFFEFSPPKKAGFYMGLSRTACNAIMQIKGRSKFLRVFGQKIGFSTDTVTYAIVPMRRKLKKRNFVQSIDYSLAVIFTNSNKSLRIISLTGLIAAFFTLFYVVVSGFITIINKKFPDQHAIAAIQSALMFFFLFVIIALFIEYIIRNIENAKEEASYHIVSEQNSNVMVTNMSQKKNVFESSRKEA